MNMDEIEQASRRAWPALEEMETPLGVLRYAAGVSRRSNSMNPVCDRSFDPQTILECSEQFFAARDLPSVIRVVAPRGQLSASHYLLDAMLGQHGYLAEAPTLVMVAPLVSSINRSSYESVCKEEWLEAWYMVKELAADSLPVHQAMLARISDSCHFALRRNANGEPDVTAMAVASGSCVGIFGVVTASGVRRQGLAQSLITELMAWGREQGARYAYLQVEAVNTAARSLYENNGFKEFYSYWYRCKELNNYQPPRSTS